MRYLRGERQVESLAKVVTLLIAEVANNLE